MLTQLLVHRFSRSAFVLAVLVVSALTPSAEGQERVPAPASPSSTDIGASQGAGEPGSVAPVPSAVGAWDPAVLELISGPPPPIPPDVTTRDERGGTTVRAIELAQGIRLDGRLDEPVYHTVPPITGLIQQVPDEGAAASERTDTWIMFDKDHVYVSARVWDSAPSSEWVANEMRRDGRQLIQNDTFGVAFDTFYDHRNGVFFYTTPLGALADMQFTNQGNPNLDWNPVWDVRTGRFEGGWTVEMEIPFKSLRYRSASTQLWGIQLRRTVRRKNEFAYLTPIPISLGPPGVFRMSSAATLVGMQVPRSGVNLDVKPYGVGGVRTNLETDPPMRNVGDGDFGIDAKLGITQSLTADVTFNTDFAQVEVDEQQVNLTRFSLFFPEKREFFLEGQGIFEFARGTGGGPGGGGNAGSGGGGGRSGGRNVPIIFFSRRIGLEAGGIVPVVAGGRVTGKIGAFDVGALTIQTDDAPTAGIESTNFTALRLRRDILRRSSIGGIFTNRSVSLLQEGASQAYGIDGSFSFYENVQVVTYYAKTKTPGVKGRDTSYYGRFAYRGDRYSAESSHLFIEKDFVPEVGFVKRSNIRRTFARAAFSPRPQSIESVRQFRVGGRFERVLTADTGLLESRLASLQFNTEFESSDGFSADVANFSEILRQPFEITAGVILPVGAYDFTNAQMSYRFGQHRKASGSLSFRAGSFWSGDIKVVEFNQGRVAVFEQFSIEPSVSVNWVNLPEGSFRTELIRTRFSYTFSPRMFFSGLVQYNSSGEALSSNLRLRWEYTPGSELFIVYTDDHNTDPFTPDRFSELRSRGLAVKFTRLFRF